MAISAAQPARPDAVVVPLRSHGAATSGPAPLAGLVVFLRDCQGNAYFDTVEDDASAQPPLLAFPQVGRDQAASLLGTAAVRLEYVSSPLQPRWVTLDGQGADAGRAVTRASRGDTRSIIAGTTPPAGRSSMGRSRCGAAIAVVIAGVLATACGDSTAAPPTPAHHGGRHGRRWTHPAAPSPASSARLPTRTTPRSRCGWRPPRTPPTSTSCSASTRLRQLGRVLLGGRRGVTVVSVSTVGAGRADVTLSGDIVWCLGKSANDPAATCSAVNPVSGHPHTYAAAAGRRAVEGRRRRQRQQRPRPQPAGLADGGRADRDARDLTGGRGSSRRACRRGVPILGVHQWTRWTRRSTRACRRAGLALALGGARHRRRRPGVRPAVVQHRAAAAEHHRRAAPRPRLRLLHPGHPVAPPPHARLRGGVVSRHRPRGDRHPERHRASAGRRGDEQGGDRPRDVPGARRRLVRGVRRAHLRADAPPRLHLRLVAGALHARRRVRARHPHRLQGPLRRRSHLPRPAHRQLVPERPVGDQRRGDRLAGAHRHPGAPALPHRGRRGHRGRDGAPGDHARRHRGRRGAG